MTDVLVTSKDYDPRGGQGLGYNPHAQQWRPMGSAAHVDAFGGAGDGRDVEGVTVSSGSTTATASSGSPFRSSDVGKTVWLLTDSSIVTRTIVGQGGSSLTLDSAPGVSGTVVACIGTDNADAIADAFAAATSGNEPDNHVQFGSGMYLTSQVLPDVLHGTRDFLISGTTSGGMSYGHYTGMDTRPGTELRYMGTGNDATVFLKADYTRGFHLEKMAIRNAHPGFTGFLISLDHTWGSYFDHFLFGGVWNGINGKILKMPRTIEAQFTDGMLERCKLAIDTVGYANACTFTRVVWLACDAAIGGAWNQVTFVSCVWEPRGGSMTSDPTGEVSHIAAGLNGATFIGCGWWDATGSTGAWIRPVTSGSWGKSGGVTIIGGYYEPRTPNEVLVKVDATGIDGLTILGLRSKGVMGGAGKARVVEIAGPVTDLVYQGNSYNDKVESGLDSVDPTIAVAFSPDSGFRRVFAHGSVSSALDLIHAATQTATLTGNVTLSLPALPAGTGVTLDLYLTQDGTGGWDVTWPAEVRWDGGSAPALAADDGDTTHLELTTLDGGSTWLGRKVAEYA